MATGRFANVARGPFARYLGFMTRLLLLAMLTLGAYAKPSIDHWSLQALVATEPSDTIDDFVVVRLQEQGLIQSPPADRIELIRRLYLDVLGLPPSPEDIEHFTKNNEPDAWSRLVDSTLASPHYGERWAQHWLDVVRYADTHGFEVNTPRPNAWPYRDWVINALNADMPYNEFVTAQLAGKDEATGFLVTAAALLPGQIGKDEPSIKQARQDELNEIVVNTGSAFLGLTVACARCHDHKFDAITQADYYAMQAVFAGVRYGERDVRKTPSPANSAMIEQLTAEIATIDQQLANFEPVATAAETIVIDDEDEMVEFLTPPQPTKGRNPAGSNRGFKDDPGSADRLPNISGGRYSWWQGKPNRDLIAYRPQAAGDYRIWLSWGCGWNTHATDARYLLDKDGNPATREDQVLLAMINQQTFADGSDSVEQKPKWSGLKDVGVHQFSPESAVILQSLNTDRPLTADAIVLQHSANALPQLRPPVDSRVNVERFAPVQAKFVRFTVHQANQHQPCIDELEIYAGSKNVAIGARASSSGDYPDPARHRLAYINDGRYGNGRSWIAKQQNGGWVQIELPAPVTIDRIVWGRDREGKFTDRTATDYRIEVATEPGQWQTVASSADRLPMHLKPTHPEALTRTTLSAAARKQANQLATRRNKLQQQLAALSKARKVFAGRFSQPPQMHRLHRGDPMQPREAVQPGTIQALGSLEITGSANEHSRRIALAKWITDPKNPLTARVMVNRIWQHHFGTGIVDTPSDFGGMGGRPSHPRLLDWLAAEFIRSGWSMKHIHRLILNSQTYQQSSQPVTAAAKLDAQNRLLWRYPPRRLEAEVIRDSILHISGALDLARTGGPGFSVFKSNSNYVRVYDPKESFGPAEWRRMVYMHRVRMEKDGVFGAFDRPDAGQNCAKRARSTTALQALNLFNSAFAIEQAERFARRVQREAGPNADDQIARAFALAFGRAPTATESTRAQAVASEHGMATVCRALFNANELVFMP